MTTKKNFIPLARKEGKLPYEQRSLFTKKEYEEAKKQTALAIFKELIREGHDGNFCEVDGMHIHMEEWQRIKEKWTK